VSEKTSQYRGVTDRRFWHPFADMERVLAQGELVIDRGEGARVFDVSGRSYIDATASLWYCNVGHGRDEIAEAVRRQMRQLEAYSTFGDLANPPVLELADRVSSLSPVRGGLVFFTSGGSDSVDTAIKLARRYWHALGETTRTVVVGRTSSYHGMHLGGTSIGGIKANRDDYGELVRDSAHVAWDSASDFSELVERVGADRIAAFFCEPVIGAGGVLHAPEGYLRDVRDLCRQTGILFVADEVITGFGRVGSWFASDRFGLEPDIIVCAKGITSGYVPLGALIVSRRVAEPFIDGTVGLWRHGYTYSGHASAAAAAIANLDIIEREGLVERALELETELAAALKPLESHDLVSEVRVREGVLAAVQIEPEAIADDPALPQKAILALREAGAMSRTLATGAIHISPPLVITRDELDELASAIHKALEACSASMARS
jgi:putrescine aminotransferase